MDREKAQSQGYLWTMLYQIAWNQMNIISFDSFYCYRWPIFGSGTLARKPVCPVPLIVNNKKTKLKFACNQSDRSSLDYHVLIFSTHNLFAFWLAMLTQDCYSSINATEGNSRNSKQINTPNSSQLMHLTRQSELVNNLLSGTFRMIYCPFFQSLLIKSVQVGIENGQEINWKTSEFVSVWWKYLFKLI